MSVIDSAGIRFMSAHVLASGLTLPPTMEQIADVYCMLPPPPVTFLQWMKARGFPIADKMEEQAHKDANDAAFRVWHTNRGLDCEENKTK